MAQIADVRLDIAVDEQQIGLFADLDRPGPRSDVDVARGHDRRGLQRFGDGHAACDI